MNADEIDAAEGCRAAIAVVTACRGDVAVTVVDAVGDASLPWTVVALGHMAAGLLAVLPAEEAEAWLQGRALRIAVDLAELEQPAPGREVT